MGAVPLPPGYHSVNPYFVVTDAQRFIGFLIEVLEGVEVGEREIRGDGAVDHADIVIGDSLIMMSEKYPARPRVDFAFVADVDATFGRALATGSMSILEPTEQPWGDRVAGITDPFDKPVVDRHASAPVARRRPICPVPLLPQRDLAGRRPPARSRHDQVA